MDARDVVDSECSLDSSVQFTFRCVVEFACIHDVDAMVWSEDIPPARVTWHSAIGDQRT